jgi:hypothetical protein
VRAMSEQVAVEFVVWACGHSVQMHDSGGRCQQCGVDGSCRLLYQARQLLVEHTRTPASDVVAAQRRAGGAPDVTGRSVRCGASG